MRRKKGFVGRLPMTRLVATPISPRHAVSHATPHGSADAANPASAMTSANRSTRPRPSQPASGTDSTAPMKNPARLTMPMRPAATADTSPASTSAGTIAE